MNQSGDALGTVEYWIRAAVGFFAGLFGVIESGLRQILSQIGVGDDIQSGVILGVMVLFIMAVLRLFAGVFRVLLAVFLIFLALHILLPNAGL